tara:strand:- start:2141 stop:2347 length:207 start_codon:yes stop_codon:yes gene_type:complete
MVKCKAISRVTIGAGDIVNTTEGDRLGSNKFNPSDTADLSAEQLKKYSTYFKKVDTQNNKEKKTGKNK